MLAQSWIIVSRKDGKAVMETFSSQSTARPEDAVDDWNDSEDPDGSPPQKLGSVVFMALAAATIAYLASMVFG